MEPETSNRIQLKLVVMEGIRDIDPDILQKLVFWKGKPEWFGDPNHFQNPILIHMPEASSSSNSGSPGDYPSWSATAASGHQSLGEIRQFHPSGAKKAWLS